MIATVLLFLGESYRFVLKHRRAVVIALAAIALLVGVGLGYRACINYRIETTANAVTGLETEKENKDAVSKTAASQADQKTGQAQNASNASKTAIQQAHDARNANVKDASSGELHKAHCDAYPEDCR